MIKEYLRSSHPTILLFSIIILISSYFLIEESILKSNIINILFIVVLVTATLSLNNNSENNYLFYLLAVIIIIRIFSNYITDNSIIHSFAIIISVGFFLVIVYRLVFQVAKSKIVDSTVILESINAYLLIGLSNSILARFIYEVSENAYSFSNPMNGSLSDFIYYGFITQTTIGYGDIAPISNIAKLHSITFGITGQLYLTIIIAILVGKFLSQKNMKV